jgi:hypothetical protein
MYWTLIIFIKIDLSTPGRYIVFRIDADRDSPLAWSESC